MEWGTGGRALGRHLLVFVEVHLGFLLLRGLTAGLLGMVSNDRKDDFSAPADLMGNNCAQLVVLLHLGCVLRARTRRHILCKKNYENKSGSAPSRYATTVTPPKIRTRWVSTEANACNQHTLNRLKLYLKK